MPRRPALAAALLAVPLALALPWSSTAAVTGRVVDPERRARITFNLGQDSPIDGGVQETERPLNDIRDEIDPEAPESFTFDELGLSESDSTYGLSFEYQWKWATLFVHSSYLDASADGVAPRDLFIGVKSVRFEGREFDYQRIPGGTAYHGEIDLLATQIRGAITPVTLDLGGDAQFVPWLTLGLFALAGQFDVDAGPAQGVQLYENPPRQYVIGGRSEGEAAALAPEIGLGGELLFRLTDRHRLGFQGTYAFADIAGSSSDLGVSSRNEKDIDLDYTAYDARVFVELPLGATSNVLVGAEYRRIDVSALAEAKDRPADEVAELREKFNKNVDFELETVLVFAGFRW